MVRAKWNTDKNQKDKSSVKWWVNALWMEWENECFHPFYSVIDFAWIDDTGTITYSDIAFSVAEMSECIFHSLSLIVDEWNYSNKIEIDNCLSFWNGYENISASNQLEIYSYSNWWRDVIKRRYFIRSLLISSCFLLDSPVVWLWLWFYVLKIQ